MKYYSRTSSINHYLAALLAAFCFSVSATAEQQIDCNNAYTTIEINHCAKMELNRARSIMMEYMAASIEQHVNDPALAADIESAQADWNAYLKSHCNAVHTLWRQGTIRGAMTIACKTRLTRQRTHDIWTSFLADIGSNLPVLPEPEK